jgi:hypothetical protein
MILVGFEVLTAVGTKMAVFWVVAPCSLVEVYHRFRGPCCLHHQGYEFPHFVIFFILLLFPIVFSSALSSQAL